ncbi:MAG: beta-phosphoglucomutase [Acidobacteriota bacterium]
MKICGFIFDLDGVITDTAEYHFRAWKRLADEEGIAFTREDNEQLRGRSRRDSLLQLLGGRTYPEKALQEMMDRKNRYYVESIQNITPDDLLPGAQDLLNEICEAEFKCALGSASKNARAVVDRLGIGHSFDAISDGYSVERQKPAPDLFVHAAGQLDLPPRECVVFEDAAVGIDAARAAGFHSIGLGPVERVGAADAVFPSLAGIHLAEVFQVLDTRQPIAAR